jgi:predicted dehydrogenase
MDLMIHDIDVALALAKSPVTHVDALGVSVMGDHEDMVSARLRFASGAVANLTASRTSYAPVRTMHVFTPRRFAAIDFAARRSTVVDPRSDVVQRTLRIAEIDDGERQQLRERLFEELLVKQDAPAIETNAIEQELVDFASAIRTGRAPRVTGVDGRDAVAVAERILAQVRSHEWDGANSRRVGPLAAPILPLPLPPIGEQWISPDDTVILRRKAG